MGLVYPSSFFLFMVCVCQVCREVDYCDGGGAVQLLEVVWRTDSVWGFVYPLFFIVYCVSDIICDRGLVVIICLMMYVIKGEEFVCTCNNFLMMLLCMTINTIPYPFNVFIITMHSWIVLYPDSLHYTLRVLVLLPPAAHHLLSQSVWH